MSRPRVSVIVPMYESSATVGETIESVRAQAFEDWEIVVVDDGSTDGSGGVVERAAARDGRVRLVRQENRGLAGARNTGIEASGGEYVYFLDADDWLAPGGLGALYGAACASPHGAAFGGFAWHDAGGAALVSELMPSCPEAGLNEFLDFNRLPVHGQMMSRTTLGKRRFREQLRVVEDYDLWLRLGEQGVRWIALDRVVCRYRLRPGSLSKRYGLMLRTLRTILTESFERARAIGWARERIDLSDQRLARTIHRHAMEYATVAALNDRGGWCHTSAMLFASCGSGLPVTPEDAAAMAYWCLPYGACRAPSAWKGDIAQFCAALDRWWGRCEGEGWAERGLVGSARRALAAWMVEPRDVARGLLAGIDPERPIEVLGFGANGRIVVEEIGARRWRAAVRDDALSARSEGGRTGKRAVRVPDGVLVVDSGAPFRPGAQCIMTPNRDEAYLAKLPRGLDVRRWSEERERRSAGELERLLRAWPRAAGAARGSGSRSAVRCCA